MALEQVTAFVLAISALLGAFSAVLLQLRGLRSDLNARLSEMVESAALAAEKRGELAGRDYVWAMVNAARAASTDPRLPKLEHPSD